MPATYTLIASTIYTSNGSSNVVFSSIPNTYTDLVVRGSVKSTSTSTGSIGVSLRLNADSSTLYSYTRVYGESSPAVGSTRATALTSSQLARTTSTADTGSTNIFNNFEFYIPNYNSSVAKCVSGVYGWVQNSTSHTGALDYTGAHAGLYTGTTAITTVTLVTTTGFASGSSFYLYGISNS